MNYSSFKSSCENVEVTVTKITENNISEKNASFFGRYQSLSFLVDRPATQGLGQRTRIRRLKMSLGQRCHSRRRLERQLWNDRTSRAIIFPPVVLTTPKSIIPGRMLYDAPAVEKKDFSRPVLKLASSLVISIVWLSDNDDEFETTLNGCKLVDGWLDSVIKQDKWFSIYSTY